MTMTGTVGWGIVGTAKIARTLFLPSLREAGGEPAAVAARDRDRAVQWAAANGVTRAVVGYENLIEDPEVAALSIPLPNALHGAWTIPSLRAPQTVPCHN